MSTLEAVLRRERAVIGSGLAALALFAWIELWRGAGMGMSGAETTVLTLLPYRHADPAAGMAMPLLSWASAAMMWWVMMVAMMTPSAAPLVLLYGRVARQSGGGVGGRTELSSTSLLFTGYLLVWLVFSLLAAALEVALQRAGLLSSAMQWSRSALLSAAVLTGAGVYQLSSVKHRCLAHCREPLTFLTHAWRPGRLGALILGFRHGAWCVGCCWMLMALLFVGGVMNLAWVAVLALLVLAEKISRRGVLVSRITGITLIGWGLATLAA